MNFSTLKPVLVKALHAFLAAAAAVVIATYQKFATGQAINMTVQAKLLLPALTAAAAVIIHGVPAVVGNVNAARAAKFTAAVEAAVKAQAPAAPQP